MGPETWAIAAVGVVLAGLIHRVNRNLRSDMAKIRSDMSEIRRDVGDVRMRIARLEGLFKGFARQQAAAP